MQYENDEQSFDLLDVEIETLRRAALQRSLPFEPNRRSYSAKELSDYGLVREAFNSAELKSMGYDNTKVVTIFDAVVRDARERLLVDAPFARSIRKWQLPIDLSESRTLISEFPADTFVEPHVHPANSDQNPGGSLRTVLRGFVDYAGKRFEPGDWFYIPNGVPYSFRTDPHGETMILYSYAFFAPAAGNRFSFPIDLTETAHLATSAA